VRIRAGASERAFAVVSEATVQVAAGNTSLGGRRWVWWSTDQSCWLTSLLEDAIFAGNGHCPLGPVTLSSESQLGCFRLGCFLFEFSFDW